VPRGSEGGILTAHKLFSGDYVNINLLSFKGRIKEGHQHVFS